MVVAGKRQWINAITNSNTITNSEKSRVLIADNAPAYKIALSWSNIQPHHAEISTTFLYFCVLYCVFCILYFLFFVLSFRICIELRHVKTLIRVSTSMTPIFCFMYLWYSLVTKLKGWILTGTFITMITVKMMIMITTVAIVVTIIVTMITIKIITVIHLRCRHVCLREHICEKFLQDRRCENGERQKIHFPVLSASI